VGDRWFQPSDDAGAGDGVGSVVCEKWMPWQ